MDRRSFLHMSGAGVLLPAFLVDALAQDGAERAGDEPSPFERARDEAARSGKPLLVFPRPSERDEAAYGAAIGDMILHADDALLADLSLVVGTVATLDELQRAYPRRITPQDVEGAYMLLVETEGAPRDFVPVRATLGARPAPEGPPPAQGPATAREWIRPLQDALRKPLSGGPDTLERRARTASAAIGEDARRAALVQLRRDVAAADVAALTAGAAVLAPLAVGDDEAAAHARALLARAAREALVLRAPKGAVWHDSGHGCAGTWVDEQGEVPVGIECGIGFVPAESRRFLEYYVQPFLRR
jgi:hypothetical protein